MRTLDLQEFEEIDTLQSQRRFKTVDIVRRLGVITAEQVSFENYPVPHPVKVFNASVLLDGEELSVFSRFILGCHKNTSAILGLRIHVEDVLSGIVSKKELSARIVVGTDTQYDFWGAEDPRVQKIDGSVYMTYTGRTLWYFEEVLPEGETQRVVPLLALSTDGFQQWNKIGVLNHSPVLQGEKSKSSKNLLLIKRGSTLFVLHRPFFQRGSEFLFPAVVSKTNPAILRQSVLTSISLNNDTIVFRPAKFEFKIGWAGTPVPVASDEYLVFMHGVDAQIKAYRLFALLLKAEKDRLYPVAVTPHYIMEPKEPHEKYGDRAMVVFCCGAQQLDDQVLLSYGAADAFIGFGCVDLSEILHLLDKTRFC